MFRALQLILKNKKGAVLPSSAFVNGFSSAVNSQTQR
jgi:hypothetical protein